MLDMQEATGSIPVSPTINIYSDLGLIDEPFFVAVLSLLPTLLPTYM